MVFKNYSNWNSSRSPIQREHWPPQSLPEPQQLLPSKGTVFPAKAQQRPFYLQSVPAPDLPLLCWNHIKQDTWEKTLQSVVNGQKLNLQINCAGHTYLFEYQVARTKINIQTHVECL